MKIMAMAVYDSKAECFGSPVFVRQSAQGIRWFTSCVADDKHEYAQFPEDYVLFELGTYDDGTGELDCLESGPRSVVRASAVREQIMQQRKGGE